jgi:hypothetical protein
MIIRRGGEGVLAIAQPDHAALAGVFADAWLGQADRASPSLRSASYSHDDGWIAWEEAPTVDEHGRPHDFLTVAMAQRVDIYRRGVGLLADGDLLAALLTSLHFTRLLAEGLGSFSGEPRRLGEAFLAEQLTWEIRTRRDLGEPHHAEDDYLVLRAVDFLSLVLCLRPREELDGQRLPAVHLGGDDATSIRLGLADAGAVTLDPYPFAVEPLEGTVPALALPRPVFADDAAYRSALQAAEPVELRFTLARSPR